MTQRIQQPNKDAFARSVNRLRETCRQLEALTLLMDDTIAQIEAENQKVLCIFIASKGQSNC